MHNSFTHPSGLRVHPAAGSLLLIALAGVMLGACARFHDKPLSATKVAADFELRSLADNGLKAFLETNHFKGEWPCRSWDLNALTLAAFYFHPDLDVARAQLSGANAAGITAGARPNPTVSLTPTYDTTTPPPWILGLSFDIPIETMGKRGYRIANAAHLSEAARLNLASTGWQVRSRVRKSLLVLYGAGESEALLKKQEIVQAESVRLLEAQLQAGAVSPFEVTQSRVALNQTRFALHDAERQAATGRVQLAEALGVPLAALDGVSFSFDAFKRFLNDVPDAIVRRQALLNRTDIRSGLAEYAAVQSALQLEIAKQYPNIHLNPGYQLDQTDNKWTLGLTLELPVVNQNQGPIAEAEAKRAERAARFNALQARVLSEIEQAVAGYRASVKKADAAASLNQELETQLHTAQGMLEAGEISRVELAQRQLELTTAALAQLDALVKTQESLGSLEDALQSPAEISAVTEESPRAPQQKPSRLLQLMQSISLPSVKGGFDMMAIDLTGKRLFLNAEDNNTTEVIDLAAGKLAHTIIDMHEPKWVVLCQELNKLYIANGDGRVRVLDSRTFKALRSVEFKEKANNLRFDPKTHELFVGVGKTFGAIGIVDTRTDTITAEIHLASFPKQFEVEGDLIYVNVPEASHVAVIDRRKNVVVSTWPVQAAKGNVPMGFDRAGHRLFIGCEPGRLAVLDSRSGKQVAALDIASDPDGVHYDARHRRIYISCGAGSLDVVRQVDADHYELAGRLPTAKGAATSLFVPELDELFLAVPQREAQVAELRVYSLYPN
jgi:cobalt-zinc-cadmium efflux system outer membrane protein